MLVELKKKTDHATEIANIKNDYVTNAALNARHKDLIPKKIDTEVKKINDKIASNLERYASSFRGKNFLMEMMEHKIN